MKDMSGEWFEEKLSEIVIRKYLAYVEFPIMRTVDVVANNAMFLGQLYCVIKLGYLERPE